MPVSITTQFNINSKKFDKTGAFDAVLDMDSKLFIHPDLLKSSQVPEFKDAYNSVYNHFRDIMTLLTNSRAKNDRLWREAETRLKFSEFKGICIGYSKRGTGGSGMGGGLRQQLITTAKEIIDAGINDPTIFELVGLFEENIGCDRISDMVGRIIRRHLIRYSERVFKEMGVEGQKWSIEGKIYIIPRNPFNNQPVILLPKDILDTLPIALSWHDISYAASVNEELRRKINNIISEAWARGNRNPTKQELKELLLRNPDLLRKLLDDHKRKRHDPYDFTNDPDGEVSWHQLAWSVASTYHLTLALPTRPTIDDVEKIVHKICEGFIDVIENKGLWKNLYKDGRQKPHHESYAQRFFYALACNYCKVNNLDISPESNGGQGPVDFKISAGDDSKVVVEVKLSTNPYLIEGYKKQLPAYQKAEGTQKGVYLVIDFGKQDERIKKLFESKNKFTEKNSYLPEIFIVDASVKKSASKV